MGNVVDFDPRKRQKWKVRRKAPTATVKSRLRKVATEGSPDWMPGLGLAFGIGILAVAMLTSPMASSIGCDIKGNVSSSGELIYHVPGQEYYQLTVVNPMKGERWFCTEEEAREAGWRKAKR